MFKKYIIPLILLIIAAVFGYVYYYETKPSIFDHYQVTYKEKKELMGLSKSQMRIHQDVFVYLESGKKREGFFVEFGATDGITGSNSYMLEKNFAWYGILAEPAVSWHKKLKKNRPQSNIETQCVWKDTGETISFTESTDAALSTVTEFVEQQDNHAAKRKKDSKTYEVTTISLLDLLKKYNAPKEVDYLSIDTEGSEFDILDAFFKENTEYKIKIITCEHNYMPNREKIYDLLTSHGYKRKYENFSKWDDFYVLEK